jgi:hypothetical protein
VGLLQRVKTLLAKKRKSVGVAGNVRVEVRSPGQSIPRLEFENNNILTWGGRKLFANIIGGYVPTGEVWLALGLSGTTPAESDTQLYSEYYRQAATIQTYDATLMFNSIVDNLNGNIGSELKEFGLFWDGADETPGSGILIARVLARPPFVKVDTDEVEVFWSYKLVNCFEGL